MTEGIHLHKDVHYQNHINSSIPVNICIAILHVTLLNTFSGNKRKRLFLKKNRNLSLYFFYCFFYYFLSKFKYIYIDLNIV